MDHELAVNAAILFNPARYETQFKPGDELEQGLQSRGKTVLSSELKTL